MPRSFYVALSLVAALLTGCGGGEYDTAPVTGTVTFNGQPVTTGKIRFVPQGESPDALLTGKPAAGEVQSDGTFVLTTYEEGDGAILGKHRVYFSPPEGNSTDETQELDANGDPLPSKATTQKGPFANCGFATEKIVEDTADGENTYNLELTTVVRRPEGYGGEEYQYGPSGEY
jgi:hypothetical protein